MLRRLGRYQKQAPKKKVYSNTVVFAMPRTSSIDRTVLEGKHLKRETSWSRVLYSPCYLIIVKLSENIVLETTLLSWKKKTAMKNEPTVRVPAFCHFRQFYNNIKINSEALIDFVRF